MKPAKPKPDKPRPVHPWRREGCLRPDTNDRHPSLPNWQMRMVRR
jgi:hypothetical protein